MGTPFVHLHLHTQYSLLDGANKLDALFARIVALGQPAVAMTDHGNLFGAVDFYTRAQEAGVKPIIGCELYLAPGSRFDRAPAKGTYEGAFHLTVLAMNEAGYRNLCRLVTAAHLEGFYYKPRVDRELLWQHHEGLIVLSGCLNSELSQALVRGDLEGALRLAGAYRERFDDGRYFLELQPNRIPDQAKVNAGLLEIHRRTGIPLVATNDCHYLVREDAESHDVLLAIQTGKTLNDPTRWRFGYDDFYVKSGEEMAAHFRDLPEAIANTLAIAERVSLTLAFGRYAFPRFDTPDGESLERYLERAARAGLEARLVQIALRRGTDVEHLRPLYLPRLEYELATITKVGFAGYFLIVADFINEAKRRGIPVGPGRGSAAGSLVAYALGITDLDPIEHKLLFERFLNPERVSMPDIDVDFCMDRRDEVIEYVCQKYGRDRVAQIITFGSLQARAAIRDVGRVLDLPYGEVDRIAKLVPNVLNITLDEALEQEPRLRELAARDATVGKLIAHARAIEGLFRHASVHAAGVVISDRPLVEHLPLYRGTKGELVTQFAMNDVERIGLVKFDFLGLKTLTVLDRACRLVKASRGETVDLQLLPLDDPQTYALLARGDTTGVFQLESSGIRELAVRLKPERFDDIVALLSLYRPGPLESGMVDDFIRRRHGRTPVSYPLPQLEPVLKDTYGVIVYQEQVMQIAQVVASYSLGEADLLRRAMGKKKPEEMAAQRTRFVEGAVRNGVSAEKARAIFDLMEKFAGYGFNRAHSAAYALITYQTAYLKAHYRPEFMAALLTCDMGDTDKVIRYLADCRDAGIAVLPPCVNASEAEFTVVGGAIRFGLAGVKNVGTQAVESILEARRAGGPFTDLFDFCERVDLRRVNRRVIEALIKCGAFDSLGAPRAALLASLDRAMEAGVARQREREMGQATLFAALGPAVRRPAGPGGAGAAVGGNGAG
ncbi:MAG TPA: DNA polymerase III subunit alpha, partial [Thermodesulfobacteriota bacterium]|nr:DNA polymerase III subunit alpha [Thermodesulfobacteriota bacterium]